MLKAQSSDYFTFIEEMSRGFRSWHSPFQSDVYLIYVGVFIIISLLFVAIAFLYVRLKNTESGAGKVEKYRRMLVNSIKKHLTTAQFKIIKDISSILHFENPVKIFEDKHYFEKAIDRLLEYRFESGDITESMDLLCRDIVVTYEKIYHFSEMSAPLENLNGLEINRLIYIISQDNRFFIGKLISREESQSIDIVVLNGLSASSSLLPSSPVTCYTWRSGDAHYIFKTVISRADGLKLELKLPDTFRRFEDDHHPLIEVNLECVVFIEKNKFTEPVRENGMIMMLNESEIVLRCSENLEFFSRYPVEFTMDDFVFSIEAQVIRGKFIKETNIYYYNFKIVNLSPQAKNVIRKHISEYYSRSNPKKEAAVK